MMYIMRKMLLILLISIPMLVIGQKQVDRVTLPIKDDKVFYEEVISVEGLKATDIYFQAHKWLAEKFVDSKEVIRVNDQERGVIIGAGKFDYGKGGFGNTSYNLI